MTTTTLLSKETTMSKRITIFKDALQDQFDIIKKKMVENSHLIHNVVEQIATNLMPPYPIIFAQFDVLEETYHISTTGFIVQSCIMQLYKDKETISDKEWLTIIDVYLDIPKIMVHTNGQRTGHQEGTEDITVSDEIADMCEIIGDYIHTYIQEVPRLKHQYGVSYKIVSCLAVLYVARKLERQNIQKTENTN